MGRKVVLFSVLAVVGVVIFTAASLVTVFALTGDNAIQVEEVQLDNSFEVAPIQAEMISHSEVVEPVRSYEKIGHSGGCPFREANMQLTQAPAEKVEDQPLALVEPK